MNLDEVLNYRRSVRVYDKINDMNSAAIPDNRKRKIFGYVEQSFHMVPGLSLIHICVEYTHQSSSLEIEEQCRRQYSLC